MTLNVDLPDKAAEQLQKIAEISGRPLGDVVVIIERWLWGYGNQGQKKQREFPE